MKKFLLSFFAFVLLLCALVGGYIGYLFWSWHHQALDLPQTRYELTVQRGDTVSQVLAKLEDRKLGIQPKFFLWQAQKHNLSRKLKAGVYELRQGDTAEALMHKLVTGEVIQRKVTLIEGRTSQQYIQELQQNDELKHVLKDMDEAAIAKTLGITSGNLEGMFLPDTYVFVPGDSDLDILRRAHAEAEKHLQMIWDNRDESIPLKNPYELLILASIVEKETGYHEDRAKVAGVFVNRLRKDMLLQTDPTIIYGLGEQYTGRITKQNLTTDNEWNTYTRKGLPPGPITNPSVLALTATAHPEQHDFIFFVSRGDGTSEFAKDLDQHNRNVQKYILKQTPSAPALDKESSEIAGAEKQAAEKASAEKKKADKTSAEKVKTDKASTKKAGVNKESDKKASAEEESVEKVKADKKSDKQGSVNKESDKKESAKKESTKKELPQKTSSAKAPSEKPTKP
ncbi:endolytic transglycosylase MltG [Brackiella oedipodis]|uniref:endolytic transglycosylase MltG n=1 Tax=Brackiella oedipodis TaxID=124225 RepID=UPI00146FC84B|nr:endolytic transglycosylase MltG [Brackiella oedipodis]